jgi:sigma-E factor negative regulatory protein RseA
MADKTAEQLSTLVANETPVAASQLSAMVDDELEVPEMDLALRRLSRDHELRARWERYHLISNVMQSHLPDALDRDFAACIRQAVEAEPLPRSAAKPLPAWYKPVTGFGLAASVALVALFGLKLTQTDTAFPPESQVAAAPAASIATPLPATARLVALNPQTDDASQPVEARLSAYLANHNGYASMNSMHGMLPYVRMVGHQGNR